MARKQRVAGRVIEYFSVVSGFCRPYHITFYVPMILKGYNYSNFGVIFVTLRYICGKAVAYPVSIYSYDAVCHNLTITERYICLRGVYTKTLCHCNCNFELKRQTAMKGPSTNSATTPVLCVMQRCRFGWIFANASTRFECSKCTFT